MPTWEARWARAVSEPDSDGTCVVRIVSTGT